MSVQQCSKLARAFAFRTHAVDADQADSANALKRKELRSYGVDVSEKYPNFERRFQNRAGWTAFWVDYTGAAEDTAKQDMTALGYGSAPNSDIPFVRALAAEYEQIHEEIVDRNSWVKEYFGDRRKPLLSRSSAVISFRENAAQSETARTLKETARSDEYCRIYDGGVFGCTDDEQLKSIENELAQLSSQLDVAVRIKPWPVDDVYSVAVQMFEEKLAWEMDTYMQLCDGSSMCMYNALVALDPSASACQGVAKEGPFCVNDFNAECLYGSQREPHVLQLRHVDQDDLAQFAVGEWKVLCHQKLRKSGHFFSAHFKDGDVHIMDDLWQKVLQSTASAFVDVMRRLGDDINIFVLETKTDNADVLPCDGPYELEGSGVPRQSATAAISRPSAVRRTISKRPAAPSPFVCDKRWPKGLAQAVASELEHWSERMVERGSAGLKRRNIWACPLCLKEVQRKSCLGTHIKHYHVACNSGIASTKLKRLAEGLWSEDQVRRRAAALLKIPFSGGSSYLARAAVELRKQLSRSASWRLERKRVVANSQHVDKNIRMLLDVGDSRYILSTDVGEYVHVSGHYYCTTRLMNALLAAMLHPETKGSTERVFRHLDFGSFTMRSLCPKQRALRTSLMELVLKQPMVHGMVAESRARADKRVLGIDGQYSTMMSIQDQTKHGSARNPAVGDEPEALKVALTVRCPTGILITKPARSEKFEHLLETLREAVGRDGEKEVLIVFSDAPVTLDTLELYQQFPALLCVCKDTLHIALKLEQATREKINPLTSLLRRCLCKLQLPCDDGLAFFVAGRPLPEVLPLARLMRQTTPRMTRRRVSRIEEETFPTLPYPRFLDFLRDVAAIANTHKRFLSKSIGSGRRKVSVFASLQAAMGPTEVGYLQNIGRFAARYPCARMLHGTTHNEAYHLELKAFFRNVMRQSRQHARMVCAIATVAKLVAGYLGGAETVVEVNQVNALTAFADILRSMGQ